MVGSVGIDEQRPFAGLIAVAGGEGEEGEEGERPLHPAQNSTGRSDLGRRRELVRLVSVTEIPFTEISEWLVGITTP
jgi:hypothetical protein